MKMIMLVAGIPKFTMMMLLMLRMMTLMPCSSGWHYSDDDRDDNIHKGNINLHTHIYKHIYKNY